MKFRAPIAILSQQPVTLHFRLLVWRAEREAWLKVIWLWALEWSPHNYSIMTLLTIDNSMKIHRTRSKDRYKTFSTLFLSDRFKYFPMDGYLNVVLCRESEWLRVRCSNRLDIDMDILQCISRSLWKKRNPQICMNGGFYGQHSFWTAPFNLIRVQFGISRASDILFWGFLFFISREERGFNLYSETWQQLRPLSFLSLSLYLGIKMDVFT